MFLSVGQLLPLANVVLFVSPLGLCEAPVQQHVVLSKELDAASHELLSRVHPLRKGSGVRGQAAIEHGEHVFLTVTVVSGEYSELRLEKGDNHIHGDAETRTP